MSRSTEQPRSTERRLAYNITKNEDLALCEQHAVLDDLRVSHQLRILGDLPKVDMSRARKLMDDFGYSGEFITMKRELHASEVMQKYLHHQLTRAQFKDYEVCDVGFWDLDVSTDTGFTWHHDHNWNMFLRPDHRTYHGWLVNSATADCNSTLAISENCKYNECNSDEFVGISDIRNDDVIRPDVVVPLTQGSLVLFPYGAVHRTYKLNDSLNLEGHRLCTSFVLHHKDDRLNDAKIAALSDVEVREIFKRYPLEKAFETGHYMIQLLEQHPRTGPLMKQLLDELYA